MIKGTDLIPTLRAAAAGKFDNMSAAGAWVLNATGGQNTPFATFLKSASVGTTAAAITLRGVKEAAWKDLLAGIKAKNASKVKAAAAAFGGAVAPPKRAKTPAKPKPKPKRAKTPAKPKPKPKRAKTPAKPRATVAKRSRTAPKKRTPRPAAAPARRAAATAVVEQAVVQAVKIAAKGTATRGKKKVRFDLKLTPVK